MKHPHEVPRRYLDFEWLVAKFRMGKLYPTDWKEIDEACVSEMVEDLAHGGMGRKDNPHFVLNAYQELLFDFLRKEKRLDESLEVRELISELKRRVRNKSALYQEQELYHRADSQYKALVLEGVQRLAFPLQKDAVVHEMVTSYILLRDYKEKMNKAYFEREDEDLLALIYEVFIEYAGERMAHEKLSADQMNTNLEVLMSASIEAAHAVQFVRTNKLLGKEPTK